MSDPAPTFGPEDLQRAVEAGGAQYRGLQARRGHPPLLLFDHPQTGSTLTVDPVEVLAASVRARLAERPESVVLATVGQRVAAQLERLAEGVELLAEVQATDTPAWGLVLRRLGKEKPKP